MVRKEPLHRRKIRAELKKKYGWEVISHVPGTVDVRVPYGQETAAFAASVRQAVEELGYAARILTRLDDTSTSWVTFTTEETLEQRDRGGH